MHRTYWSTIRIGKQTLKSAPHAAREAAEHSAEEALRLQPEAWRKRNAWKRFTIVSGYGTESPDFDIRFRDIIIGRNGQVQRV